MPQGAILPRLGQNVSNHVSPLPRNPLKNMSRENGQCSIQVSPLRGQAHARTGRGHRLCPAVPVPAVRQWPQRPQVSIRPSHGGCFATAGADTGPPGRLRPALRRSRSRTGGKTRRSAGREPSRRAAPAHGRENGHHLSKSEVVESRSRTGGKMRIAFPDPPDVGSTQTILILPEPAERPSPLPRPRLFHPPIRPRWNPHVP